MAKITTEQISESFIIAKNIYDGKITHKNGLDKLVKFGMNRNSASDYVYNYQCMVEGKLMTRNANAFGTEYFLQKIYENGGSAKLQNALISLSLHLDYYEQVSNTNVVSRRKILEQYIKKLNFKIVNVHPDEIDSNIKFIEGKSKKVLVNVFERNSTARYICVEYYGVICQVCKFDFEKNFGEIGKDFIHVHHIVDISIIDSVYELNPITDLIPVCPNCHAMLHKKKPAYKISELKAIMRKLK